MNCCQCQGIEELFNPKTVNQELAQYRKKGPAGTTRQLIRAIKAAGVQGSSVLDIGGGVGAVQHGLLEAGAQSATDVDASQAYISAASAEAERRGLADRVNFVHGNFVDLAGQIAPADVVTLDRVLCCYPDMKNLVNRSAEKARRLYGVVYPRDAWWIKLGVKVINFFFGLQKSPFRTFVHPSQTVETLLRSHGFTRRSYSRTLIWQIALYSREVS